MEITKINHVYFVMSIANGLNEDDLKSFDLFTQLFVGMKNALFTDQKLTNLQNLTFLTKKRRFF